jgi:hypothetical protein
MNRAPSTHLSDQEGREFSKWLGAYLSAVQNLHCEATVGSSRAMQYYLSSSLGGSTMAQQKLKLSGVVVAGSLIGMTAFADLANPADLSGEPYLLRAPRPHKTVISPAICKWRCRSSCPDRYSCYSLYGAYGPYGGTAYWARYTLSGWGLYR